MHAAFIFVRYLTSFSQPDMFAPSCPAAGYMSCLYVFLLFFLMSNYKTSNLRNYSADHHKILIVGTSMEELNKSCIHFAIAQF